MQFEQKQTKRTQLIESKEIKKKIKEIQKLKYRSQRPTPINYRINKT